MKLCQVIATVASKKTNATKAITDAYHTIQKTTLFDGISRTYQPRDDAGERLPSETKLVQEKVVGIVSVVTAALTDMIDTIAAQDFGNCEAKGNIVIDGVVLVGNVPVTHLLFLEKQLKDVETFVSKLPVLDPAETWNYDAGNDWFATQSVETTRTKKVPKAFVKAEATDKHPAQVDVFHEDIIVGDWKTVKSSGAIPAKARTEALERIRKLREAVIKAREEANTLVIRYPVVVAKTLFDYVFKPIVQ